MFQECIYYKYCVKSEDKYSRDNGILLSPDYHFFYDNNNFIINEDTCCVEILEKFPNCDKILGKFIPELNNYISKNYLKMRNKII